MAGFKTWHRKIELLYYLEMVTLTHVLLHLYLA